MKNEKWNISPPTRVSAQAPHLCILTMPLARRRWWRAFMEYENGTMGDMCISGQHSLPPNS